MLFRPSLIGVLLTLLAVSEAVAQGLGGSADLWKACQSQQTDQALQACSQIIEAKTEPAARLAQAHNMRATVHQRMGQPDAALLENAVIPIGRLEIAQLANDPNFRERGRLTLEGGGGK